MKIAIKALFIGCGVLVLAAVLSACGGGEGEEGETPTPTLTVEATAAPERTPTGAEAPAPSEFLDSFHFRADMSMEVDGDAITLATEGDFQAPDRHGCVVTGTLGGLTLAEEHLVVIGDDAWLDVGEGWRSTTAADPAVGEDLNLCPSSLTFWEEFPFGEELEALAGEHETVNNVPAVRYPLGEAFGALAPLGFMPSELEDVDIEVFDIWLAEDGGWPVALEMRASADAEALGEAMGLPLGTETGQEATIGMRIDISQVNDPDISVEAPAAP